jgi:DUF1680 family protein
MDEVIDVIAKAQQPDGYLSTRIILEKRKRFQDIHHHELYNMGHLMTAACIHHRATGKTSFLEIAKKTGDYLYATFKDRPPELAHFGFNPSNIMGAVELYRTTGVRKYLDLAMTFIEMRGSQPAGNRRYGLGGTDQTQDRVPLRRETEAVGHAVRANYMYSGMADVAALTGDEAYLNAIGRIWENVVSKKLYITGGVGSNAAGEAYGDNYYLPNMTAYCETCAAVANVFWNYRMFLLHGESKYIDVLERTLYNGLLSGLGLSGDRFFYQNPLKSGGQHTRSAWFGCACCPSNS